MFSRKLSVVRSLMSAGGFKGSLAKMALNQGGFGAVKQFVGLLIGALMASIVIPLAVTQFNDADQTGWTDSQILVWGFFGLLFILGGLVLLLKMTGIIDE